VQAGYRVAEIPVVFRDRTQGRSKMSLGIALEAVLVVPRLRFGRRGRQVGAHMRALRARRQG
jgi:dolichol-phosphate mannosyltransferase